jgi:RNA 2',3'-cyclic 3'-phosphodiesterase
MRTFVAFDIDECVRRNIAVFMAKAASLQAKGVKFVEDHNLHVTIKFIGDVPEERVDTLISSLSAIAAESFELCVKGAGGFPSNNRHPRVLWAGIEKNGSLLRLFDAVDRRLFEAGIPRDRKPFHPHLTIARTKTEIEKELFDFIQSHKAEEFGRFNVQDFFLYKSELTGKGPVYSRIGSFSLNNQRLFPDAES